MAEFIHSRRRSQRGSLVGLKRNSILWKTISSTPPCHEQDREAEDTLTVWETYSFFTPTPGSQEAMTLTVPQRKQNLCFLPWCSYFSLLFPPRVCLTCPICWVSGQVTSMMKSFPAVFCGWRDHALFQASKTLCISCLSGLRHSFLPVPHKLENALRPGPMTC